MVKNPLSLLFIIGVCKSIYFVSIKLRHHQDCWMSMIRYYIKTGNIQIWKNFNPWGFKKKQLQLATSVSVHSFEFSVHLLDPKFFSDRQEHGVLVPDLLQDGHGHVGDLVTGTIEVGPDSFLQVGPSLASLSSNLAICSILSYLLAYCWMSAKVAKYSLYPHTWKPSSILSYSLAYCWMSAKVAKYSLYLGRGPLYDEGPPSGWFTNINQPDRGPLQIKGAPQFFKFLWHQEGSRTTSGKKLWWSFCLVGPLEATEASKRL